jgi:hypothetical protein
VSWTTFLQVVILILLCGLLIHDFLELWAKIKYGPRR